MKGGHFKRLRTRTQWRRLQSAKDELDSARKLFLMPCYCCTPLQEEYESARRFRSYLVALDRFASAMERRHARAAVAKAEGRAS